MLPRRACTGISPRLLSHRPQSARCLINDSARCFATSSSVRNAAGTDGLSKMQMIKKLRDDTAAPLNLVKDAIASTSSYAAAAAALQTAMAKRGEKLVAKSATREAREGWVFAARSSDGKKAVIGRVNTETDFVARSEGVVQLTIHLARAALAGAAAEDEAIGKKVTEQMSLVGETIRFGDVLREDVAQAAEGGGERVGVHCHGGPKHEDVSLGRMGAIVRLRGGKVDADELAREIVAQQPESTEEFWTLEKVGDTRTVREWAGDEVELVSWTRLDRSG